MMVSARAQKVVLALAPPALLLAALALCASFLGTRFIYNVSPSLPKGLYFITAFHGEPAHHDLVVFDIPEAAAPYLIGRGWLRAGDLLIKEIGALPGDLVGITDAHFSINGQVMGPVFEADRNGQPLPRLRGRFEIAPGELFAVALAAPESFDSRYFGPIATSKIKFRAVPVWTAGGTK